MDISYASVARIGDEINKGAPAYNTSIGLRLAAGVFASGRIDETQKMTFAPERAIHPYDVPEYQLVNERLILLTQRPLLEVKSVTLPDDSALVLDADYALWPRYRTPRTGLMLSTSVDTADLEPSAAFNASLRIDGLWGWHSDYTRAWVDTTTLTAEVSAAVTVLPVTSASALSEGMLLRLDDEYMGIVSISGANVTVKRGIRGTTAAIHAISTPLWVFTPEDTVERAVQRWAAMLVIRLGAFEQVQFETMGIVQFPPNMPPDVAAMLDNAPWNPTYLRRGQGIYRAVL